MTFTEKKQLFYQEISITIESLTEQSFALLVSQLNGTLLEGAAARHTKALHLLMDSQLVDEDLTELNLRYLMQNPAVIDILKNAIKNK